MFSICKREDEGRRLDHGPCNLVTTEFNQVDLRFFESSSLFHVLSLVCWFFVSFLVNLRSDHLGLFGVDPYVLYLLRNVSSHWVWQILNEHRDMSFRPFWRKLQF